MVKALPVDKLCRICDPQTVGCEITEEMEPLLGGTQGERRT